jgi:eukaryotic-like serine/threonine-protein kinase
MALAPGTKLGPYAILAPLGAGGMAEVYRARDTRLERTVAIKILPPQFSDDPVSRQRFEREAKTISNLNHPHICVLHDVGHQDGIDYLVMECLEGETLAKRLKKGPLPLEQVLKLGAEVGDALDKAHRNGIVHRDLKPGNIMVTPTGAKLLDFGLAKPAALMGGEALTAETVRGPSPVTEEGTIVGTFQYMSPEQVGGKEVDGRSDIFSLGAVLYETVTGKKAFEGKSQLSVASAILEKEPEPVSSIKPMTPPALDFAIKKSLAKIPGERWQNAGDLASQLRWIAEVGSQAGVRARSPAHTRMGVRTGWILAVICFLAALALATVLWTRQPLPVQVVRSSLLPPPNSSFLPYEFAVSPDGSRVAFVALGPDGKTALWIRALSGSGAQQLSGTDGALSPFWSPDSHGIGFFAENRLKTVDLAGGAVQTLCDAEYWFGGTWNRDGTILFAPELDGPIYRVRATGGAPVPVTKVSSQGGTPAHRWPFFLPDGKHFLYWLQWTSSPDEDKRSGIYVGSLDSDQSKLVLPGVAGNILFASGHILFVRDRNLLAQPFDTSQLQTTGPAIPITEQQLEAHIISFESGFTVSQNGLLVFQSTADSPTRLVWYSPAGKELGQFSEAGYSSPQFSPDGHFLAVASDDGLNGRYFIRVYDLKRGISTRLTEGGHEQVAIWSPDGKRIAYFSPAGTFASYEVPADGSALPQPLLRKVRGNPSDWSPDGHLVFMTVPQGAPLPSLEIYSEKDHQITEFAPMGVEAKFSPDGKGSHTLEGYEGS